MSHNRLRGRKDSNHKSIVAELEAKGFVVFDVSGLRNLGFDIVVCQLGQLRQAWRWQPFELKNQDRKYALTKAELKAQQKVSIPVVSRVEDILRYF